MTSFMTAAISTKFAADREIPPSGDAEFSAAEPMPTKKPQFDPPPMQPPHLSHRPVRVRVVVDELVLRTARPEDPLPAVQRVQPLLLRPAAARLLLGGQPPPPGLL